MTARAAAQLLGVHEGSFHRYVKAGRIRGFRNNGRGRILYNEDEVLALHPGRPKSPGPNGGGGRRDRKVIPLRGDQLQLLTVDQAEEQGALDEAQAAAMRAAEHFVKPHQLVLQVRRVRHNSGSGTPITATKPGLFQLGIFADLAA